MSTITCPSCGESNSESSWKYCHKCGGRLNVKSPPPAQQATPSSPNRSFSRPGNQSAVAKQTKTISLLMFFVVMCGFGAGGAIAYAIIGETFHLQIDGSGVPGIIAGVLVGGVILQVLGYRLKPRDRRQ